MFRLWEDVAEREAQGQNQHWDLEVIETEVRGEQRLERWWA